MSEKVTRVGRRAGAVLATTLLLVGCSGTPTAPSATSGQAPASGASAPVPGSPMPAASPSPAAAGASSGQTVSAPADWQAQWDATLAAANKEGSVVVFGPPGDSYRLAVTDNFAKAFPNIQVDWTGGTGGGQLTPRILTERSAGQYLEDVYINGSSNSFDMEAAGALAPIMPELIRPDVLDDSKWFDGFAAGFNDKPAQYAFGFEGSLSFSAYVNRDMVPESALSQVEQLADPQWKGKISWQDPTIASAGSTVAGQLMLVEGDAWLRQVLAQDIAVTQDGRQQVTWLATGPYPISLGVSTAVLQSFKDQGVGTAIQPLAPQSQGGSRISSGFGTLMVLDQAPHPNATKVFVNWLLSQEEQAAWIQASGSNSRRLDVPGPPNSALNPAVNRQTVNNEEYFQYELNAREVAKQVL